jgi:hypothetical protein
VGLSARIDAVVKTNSFPVTAGNRTSSYSPKPSQYTINQAVDEIIRISLPDITTLSNIYTRVSQKVKGLYFKHIYCKYTEMKLILLLNVSPLNFNAPVSTIHKFFNSVRKMVLVASLTSFSPRQWKIHRMKIFLSSFFHSSKHMEASPVSSTVIRLYSCTVLWRPSWSVLIAYSSSSIFKWFILS